MRMICITRSNVSTLLLCNTPSTRAVSAHSTKAHTPWPSSSNSVPSPPPLTLQDSRAITRRLTIVEGLFSGLSVGAGGGTAQLAAKIKLLVEAPAAVEDALASLLDSADSQLQVSWLRCET